MKSMIISEKEKKENAVPSVLESPKYPWGLRINLDEETCKKLELKAPQVGDKMLVLAMAEVMSVSNEKRLDDQDHLSVGLQITEMEIKKGDKQEKPDKPIAETLYGKGE